MLGLLAALVSNTHADIVVVLCVIALLGVAPSEVDPVVAHKPGAGRSDLLALGDSCMSGEGARTYISNTDKSGSNTCRRAPTAYAVLAVGPEKPFDHVTFLACSGARTYNVQPRPPGKDPLYGPDPAPSPQNGESGTQVDQITALGPAYRPRLAIVSLGGNDAGFSPLGDACIAPDDCIKEQDLFIGNLQRIRSALVQTYRSIRAVLPHTPVVVVPYPQPLDNAGSCGAIALSAQDRKFIQKFLVSLNQVIRSAADQVGFYYLDTMETALAGKHLQLCDPANKGGYGINFVSLESVSGLPGQRFNPVNWLHDSFHPNERGHQAMLRRLRRLADQVSAPDQGRTRGRADSVG
jgi:lysophospholipase L1-like esterase